MLPTALWSSIFPKDFVMLSIFPSSPSFTVGWGRFGFRYSVDWRVGSAISAFFVCIMSMTKYPVKRRGK